MTNQKKFQYYYKNIKRVAFIEVGNKNEVTNKKNDFESFKGQDDAESQRSHMLLVFMRFTHST